MRSARMEPRAKVSSLKQRPLSSSRVSLRVFTFGELMVFTWVRCICSCCLLSMTGETMTQSLFDNPKAQKSYSSFSLVTKNTLPRLQKRTIFSQALTNPFFEWQYSLFFNPSDFDECAVYGTCSQSCTNTEGSYSCSCVEGYLPQPDNRSCKAKNGECHLLLMLQMYGPDLTAWMKWRNWGSPFFMFKNKNLLWLYSWRRNLLK